MNEYTYDDPTISYDEPGFFYDGGFADGFGPQVGRRVYGGGGSSTTSSFNKKKNMFEILIRTSMLNEEKTITRVYQLNKDSGIKIRSSQIITTTDKITISGSLIL